MALGFVRSTAELLTCGRGITPVRGFHQLTCPLLYRSALMLVFGVCAWKWTTSVAALDPNKVSKILQVHCCIAQSLACTRKLDKCRLHDGPDLKLFILVGWLGPELSPVAWSTGAQLIILFCFRFSVVLFDRPGISIRLAGHCICRVLVFASS